MLLHVLFLSLLGGFLNSLRHRELGCPQWTGPYYSSQNNSFTLNSHCITDLPTGQIWVTCQLRIPSQMILSYVKLTLKGKQGIIKIQTIFWSGYMVLCSPCWPCIHLTYMAQAGLELLSLLHLHFKCWESKTCNTTSGLQHRLVYWKLCHELN